MYQTELPKVFPYVIREYRQAVKVMSIELLSRQDLSSHGSSFAVTADLWGEPDMVHLWLSRASYTYLVKLQLIPEIPTIKDVDDL